MAQMVEEPCIFDDYLGSVLVGETYRATERAGNTAYSVSENGIFTVFDVSDISNPVVVGSLDIGEANIEHVMVRDGLAYVVPSIGLLKIIDVNDPSSPGLLGSLPDFVLGSDLGVGDGGRVILNVFNSILYVDASNPSLPFVVEGLQHPVGGELEGYGIDGTIAYLVTDVAGTLSLEAWDITDLANRILLSTEIIRFNDTTTSFATLAISGSVVYVLDQSAGLFLYDISNPGFPVLQSSLAGVSGQSLTINGGMIYISDGFSAVQVVDQSNPFAPVLVGSYDTQSSVAGVIAKDQRVLLSGGDGFELIDVSNPANPYAGSVETSDALGLGVIGDLVIVADSFGGTKFVDVSDIDSPLIVHSSPGSGRNVHESGHHAFVARGHLGLSIWDVSDPANILVAGRLTGLEDSITDVFVDGQYAYITDAGVDLMKVVDVSDVGNPVVVGSVSIDENSSSIEVSDGRAYVGSFTSVGLDVIDLGDPLNPLLLGSIDLPNTALATRVRWPYAYVAARDTGLVIVDIADPVSMSIVGTFDVGGVAVDLELVGDIAYVAENNHGVQLIDIQDPTSPVLVGSFANENEATGIRIVESKMYITSRDLGLEIVDLGASCGECPGDLTGDGALDFFDIVLFLQHFGESNLMADFNGDGELDFFDISAFLTLFQGGCP